MGRAAGRNHRSARPGNYDPGPDTPEGDAIGESPLTDPAGSPIPSGETHIVNYETVAQPVASPAPPPLYDGFMAHGVPSEGHGEVSQSDLERGATKRAAPPKYAPPLTPPVPVPVIIVEEAGGPSVVRVSYPKKLLIPNNTSEPQLICGREPRRNRIGLLNEDSSTDIRFAQSIAGLNNGGGAILLHAGTSYTWFETQDRLYAVTTSTTNTALLSVVEEAEQDA
jgi:hypothetical protein